jgi:hypothetical protein
VKALSLWQPHVAAIALGLKTYETRDWSTNYRGPLALHAAKKAWTERDEWHETARVLMDARLVDVIEKRFPKHTGEEVAEIARIVREERLLLFGAVVCIADLVDCEPTHRLRGRIGAAEFWGDFSDGETGAGRYAFRLENVRLLRTPLAWRGMQGFFEVELGASEPEAPEPAPGLPVQLDLFGRF